MQSAMSSWKFPSALTWAGMAPAARNTFTHSIRMFWAAMSSGKTSASSHCQTGLQLPRSPARTPHGFIRINASVLGGHGQWESIPVYVCTWSGQAPASGSACTHSAWPTYKTSQRHAKGREHKYTITHTCKSSVSSCIHTRVPSGTLALTL